MLHLVFGIGRWFAGPALLVVTVTIVFVTSAIFLLGAQLDELLRNRSRQG